jgi:hypothetical protein
MLFLKVGSNGSWHKGREGAGENYIWPVPNDADQVTSQLLPNSRSVLTRHQVTTRFMQALHDAHTALGEAQFMLSGCDN